MKVGSNSEFIDYEPIIFAIEPVSFQNNKVSVTYFRGKFNAAIAKYIN